MEIHHIGLVVNSIKEHYTKYFSGFLKCAELSQVYMDEKLGVNVAFVNMNNKIYLEFVEPLNNNSPVYNFLQKHGQALHHMCFEVDNIEIECSNLQKGNYFITLPPTPAVAFNGRKVAFLLSKEADYLIELLEKE
jgi:methylmalonyl-CoA/ethylmalonyl-CoA epimerase